MSEAEALAMIEELERSFGGVLFLSDLALSLNDWGCCGSCCNIVVRRRGASGDEIGSVDMPYNVRHSTGKGTAPRQLAFVLTDHWLTGGSL